MKVANEIKVGLFALVGILLFCASVVLLGGDKFFLARTYRLRVHLTQVQGLGKGSVVSLAGVPVGNVGEIKFVEGSPDVEVTLHLEEAVKPRVTEGSKVAIKTQGALGDKFIYIDAGPATAAPMKDNDLLEADKTPDLIDMITSKGAELGQVVEVIKEVRQLVANLNHDGRSAKFMHNLVTGSEDMNKLLVEARETFRLIRTEAVVPMASVMHKIDSGQGTLGALINDPSLHNRLMGFLGEAPRNRFLKPLIRDSIQTNEHGR